MSFRAKTLDGPGAVELANKIYEVGMIALRSADLSDIIYSIHEKIMEMMDAEFVGVALVDEVKDEVFQGWGSMRDKGPAFNDHRQRTADGVVGRVCTTGEPMCVADIRQLEGVVDLVPGMRSELTVPLKLGDRIIGALDVESSEVSKFGPSETALLMALATPVAQAIHSARLLQGERRRLDQLAMLNRVARIVASTIAVDEMLSRTVEAIRESLGCTFVGAGFVDEELERVSLEAVSSELKIDLPIGHTQPIGQGVVGEAARRGRSVLVADLAEREDVVSTHGDLRCEMCCPLVVGDRVVGYLDAEEREPGAFGEDDLMLLETIADHVAQAVENARNLERLSELRKDLTGMVVHDLRNPLTVIRTTLDFVKEQRQRSGDPGAALARKYLEQSDAACAEMFLLVDSLLELNKFEAGAQRLDRRIVAAGELVRGIGQRLRVVSDAADVKLESMVVSRLPHLEIDVDLITRVLKNLVVNAIKFTPEAGRVSLEVTAATREQLEARLPEVERALLFTVCDNGPGIPAEELERIFEKFATVETRRAGRKYSTGLGLAFCKQAVAAHGGTIWAESEVGRGSTFHVLLPAESD
jgi:signal transduction histidine kinase